MTHEETIERLKELGFEHPVAAEGQIVLRGADLRGANQFRLRTRGAVLVEGD